MKLKFSLFLLPLMLLFWMHCVEPANESTPDFIYSETHKLVGKDTLEIPINDWLGYNARIKHTEIEGKDYIYAMANDEENNIFFFFDVAKSSLAFSFSVPIHGPKGVSLAKFPPLVVNMDSIFIPSRISSKINLADSSGHILRRWELASLNSKESINRTTSLNYFRLEKYKHFLFLRHVPDYPDTDLRYYKMPFETVLNLKNDSVVNRWGFHPEILRKKGGVFGEYNHIRRVVNQKGEGIFSYDSDHHIYVYDLEGNMKKYYLPSKYLEEERTYLSGTFGQTGDEVDFSYIMENGSYYNLIEDPYRNVYYRIVNLPSTPAEIHDGNTTFWDRPFSIQIINKDFELIGENVFPAKKFDIHQYFVTKNGLYLGYTHDLNPELEEDRWVFIRFQVMSIYEK